MGETIGKWIAAAIALIFFYQKIVKPFIAKTLELKTEDPIDRKTRIVFDEEAKAPNDGAELRKQAERSFKLSEADQTERIKYDATLEKLRKIIEESPRQSSDTIGALLKDA
ncbi:MAG: hypothetical protein LBI57_07285 [Helicobacteraceae bacterium]|nr:hypothetical protein [Helicobacteraceae bacterium]